MGGKDLLSPTFFHRTKVPPVSVVTPRWTIPTMESVASANALASNRPVARLIPSSASSVGRRYLLQQRFARTAARSNCEGEIPTLQKSCWCRRVKVHLVRGSVLSEPSRIRETMLSKTTSELGMNKSTLWYMKKRLERTGSIRLYNKTKPHFL